MKVRRSLGDGGPVGATLMDLVNRIRRFARQEGLWEGRTRVVAAVSGGSDSVAMLLLLHDLHSSGELILEAVAHLNHTIRPDAGADEEFCRGLAARIGTPFVAGRADVPSAARARRQSLEVTARRERRRFLDEVRRSRGAHCIATGHTQDDQAETVLLRLLRGAGRRGLGAIAPCRGRLIRPVLCLTREDLQEELRRRGQPWCEDSTNADPANPRNRIRHELLPYLERHFNPAARAALARAADVARADDVLLARAAAAAAVHVLQADRDIVRLDAPALVAMPAAIGRRVVLHALSSIRLQTSGTLQHVEVVLDVVHGRRRAADLSGLRVEHSRGSVVLVRRNLARAAPAPFQADLPIPGEIQLPEVGVAVQAEGPFARGGVEARRAGGGSEAVCVSADSLGQRLVVRSRRPGDRLRPLGLGGRKKLQDVLVDRKVSRAERDEVPIVTDALDRIVWVAGHVVGEEFRVTEHTNAVIILKLRRISCVGIRRDSALDS